MLVLMMGIMRLKNPREVYIALKDVSFMQVGSVVLHLSTKILKTLKVSVEIFP